MYVLLVEECEPQLTKAQQKEYFAKLEKDYNNIKKALEVCASNGTPEFISYALRITGNSFFFKKMFLLIVYKGSLYRFWFVTGRQHEGYSIIFSPRLLLLLLFG